MTTPPPPTAPPRAGATTRAGATARAGAGATGVGGGRTRREVGETVADPGLLVQAEVEEDVRDRQELLAGEFAGCSDGAVVDGDLEAGGQRRVPAPVDGEDLLRLLTHGADLVDLPVLAVSTTVEHHLPRSRGSSASAQSPMYSMPRVTRSPATAASAPVGSNAVGVGFEPCPCPPCEPPVDEEFEPEPDSDCDSDESPPPLLQLATRSASTRSATANVAILFGPSGRAAARLPRPSPTATGRPSPR